MNVIDHEFRECLDDAACPACTEQVGVQSNGVVQECGRPREEHGCDCMDCEINGEPTH